MEDPEQLVLNMVEDVITAKEEAHPPVAVATEFAPAAVATEFVEDVITAKEENYEETEKKTIEFNITDAEAWETGRVHEWKNTWGFIERDNQKDQHIFVHASNINSKDVHTFLRKGMEVKFQEATRADDPNRKCAVNVCNKEGEPISYFEKQGESDNFKRRDVTPGVKYKGTVKNYFFRRRFGWIQPDDEGDERRFLTKDIYVAREDILTKDFPPGLRAGTKVQFELYEDDRGLGACRVTGENGELLEVNSVRKDFENKVFTGVVEKFRLNGYLFIKPDENLKEFGMWGTDIHGDCESINTEQRPARVLEKTKVTFKLTRDRNGFHAIDINDEDGEPIVVADEDIQEDAHPHERQIYPEVFEGTVQSFSWAKGSGWVKPTELSPELRTKTTHREGYIYFYRRDLMSEDKVFGVHEDVKVRFRCYIDEKGIGACNITDHEGNSIKDQKRPTDRESVQHGVVNYYDRQKRVCHIRYKGKVHAVPKKHILVLREAEHLLRRGQRVEFIVERWRGRNFLKQVSFPDARRSMPSDKSNASPKTNEWGRKILYDVRSRNARNPPEHGRRAKPKENEYQQDQNQNNHYQSSYPNQPLFNPYQPGYVPQPHFQQNPFFAEFFNEQGRPNQGFTQYPGNIAHASYPQPYARGGHQSYV